MRYTTLLFDLDFTLFDSDVSEDRAFRHALDAVGVDWSEKILATYNEINGALWKAVERGELTPLDVRTRRFEELFDALGLTVDAEKAADAFVDGMGSFGSLYPGAREVLEELSPSGTTALVTNGLGEVQRARIERLGLEPYFDVIVISGEEGVAKPGTAIFDLAFDRMGEPERESSLMIGDSLSSDMAGGVAYGIDTCWFNRDGRSAAPDELPITHTITDLHQLLEVVRGGTPPAAAGA
jgi:YjjG family noncanonical pyrimidine nucleotidase